MKKYRVVGSSKPEFMNIEMNIVFDDVTIGKPCEVFGHQFVITQNGKVIILSSETWVMSLLEIEIPKKAEWQYKLTNHKDLRINHEVDIFVEKKVIKLSETERLRGDNGVTFLCLFNFLRCEWKYIERLSGVAFPFDYDQEYDLFIMRDEWNFDSLSTIKLLREGSFSRYNSSGRCI